ncbi:hypothetical protein EOPP23_13275 [Endozoicomonas sp. OPT23]|uniref:hypothetical protein n=1 Tax=Endozoicomonas sp. OPT23 TaxID=2072845 RepID=UPI00129B6685|nr:hypothetical protein [Endozoicomonas sp. OPT23]MRI33961.1 hypothetical protein [Endozoicomonas sp. OPT23]
MLKPIVVFLFTFVYCQFSLAWQIYVHEEFEGKFIEINKEKKIVHISSMDIKDISIDEKNILVLPKKSSNKENDKSASETYRISLDSSITQDFLYQHSRGVGSYILRLYQHRVTVLTATGIPLAEYLLQHSPVSEIAVAANNDWNTPVLFPDAPSVPDLVSDECVDTLKSKKPIGKEESLKKGKKTADANKHKTKADDTSSSDAAKHKTKSDDSPSSNVDKRKSPDIEQPKRLERTDMKPIVHNIKNQVLAYIGIVKGWGSVSDIKAKATAMARLLTPALTVFLNFRRHQNMIAEPGVSFEGFDCAELSQPTMRDTCSLLNPHITSDRFSFFLLSRLDEQLKKEDAFCFSKLDVVDAKNNDSAISEDQIVEYFRGDYDVLKSGGSLYSAEIISTHQVCLQNIHQADLLRSLRELYLLSSRETVHKVLNHPEFVLRNLKIKLAFSYWVSLNPIAGRYLSAEILTKYLGDLKKAGLKKEEKQRLSYGQLFGPGSAEGALSVFSFRGCSEVRRFAPDFLDMCLSYSSKGDFVEADLMGLLLSYFSPDYLAVFIRNRAHILDKEKCSGHDASTRKECIKVEGGYSGYLLRSIVGVGGFKNEKLFSVYLKQLIQFIKTNYPVFEGRSIKQYFKLAWTYAGAVYQISDFTHDYDETHRMLNSLLNHYLDDSFYLSSYFSDLIRKEYDVINRDLRIERKLSFIPNWVWFTDKEEPRISLEPRSTLFDITRSVPSYAKKDYSYYLSQIVSEKSESEEVKVYPWDGRDIKDWNNPLYQKTDPYKFEKHILICPGVMALGYAQAGHRMYLVLGNQCEVLHHELVRQ